MPCVIFPLLLVRNWLSISFQDIVKILWCKYLGGGFGKFSLEGFDKCMRDMYDD